LPPPPPLGPLARRGPVAEPLRAIGAALADPAQTLVCLVSTPEELAVRETVELHRELVRKLALPVGPAIVNAVPPRHFGRGDEAAITRLAAAGDGHPWLVAAGLPPRRPRGAAGPGDGRAPRP